MEGEEGGSLNAENDLLPTVPSLDPETEMDPLPTGEALQGENDFSFKIFQTFAPYNSA